MPTVTNRRKVLSIKEKVTVIQQTENGKKKADVCQEFGHINSMIQKIWKKRTKIINVFEWNRSRIKPFQKLF
jgi:CENP-B N-terminal DNA-binding domain.